MRVLPCPQTPAWGSSVQVGPERLSDACDPLSAK